MRMGGPMCVRRSVLLSWDGRRERCPASCTMSAGSQRKDAHSDGRRGDVEARKKAQRKSPMAAATRRRRRTPTPRSTMEGGAEREGSTKRKSEEA